MDLQSVSLNRIKSRTIAILGYGNQGRAHALNLRDSGVSVVVGARAGAGFERALRDGFKPVGFVEAAHRADVWMFLLPDHIIPEIYRELSEIARTKNPTIGFAHGFAFHFGYAPPIAGCGYFLVGPKGAGSVLRQRYEERVGLPFVYAITDKDDPALRATCLQYARAAGATYLLETGFAEETECDLFGEQAVLCGGLIELMENAFDILVKAGHRPEMAFFETCFEARMILDLFLAAGPDQMRNRISPTAAYGGWTRGKRLIDEKTRFEMEKIFFEIRSGSFAREWMAEAQNGMPTLSRLQQSPATSLDDIYQKIKSEMGGKI